MKILLITGQSGTGKSTIVEKLLEYDGYNNILSYTDRPQRKEEENGFTNHIFVHSDTINNLLGSSDVVAQTKIDEYHYCALRHQFDKDKVNVYIVDFEGLNDVINFFPEADIMIILIKRNDIELESYRSGRNIGIPARSDVHFCLENNGPIESISTLAGTINVLVKNNFFVKSSRTIETIEDRIKHCDEIQRYLNIIREDLEKERWYRDKPLFDEVTDYIESYMNAHYKDIVKSVVGDKYPVYEDDKCLYYVTITTTGDIYWQQENEILEQASRCIMNFQDDSLDIYMRMLVQVVHECEEL